VNTAQVIVSYSSIQEAYERDPSRIEEAVHEAAAETSPQDAFDRARLIAAWNNAMGDLRLDDKGVPVLSSPQNPLASRLQTLLVEKAIQENKVRDVTPSLTIKTQSGDVTMPEIQERVNDKGFPVNSMLSRNADLN
jgi:hypothetical protein